ncbi:MAG: hypothetical protein K0Q50_2753 [Vampirovibrio sp.]|jgi:hypothetical protein|nr:hypothetical protein [Vampirovibrio sp.]
MRIVNNNDIQINSKSIALHHQKAFIPMSTSPANNGVNTGNYVIPARRPAPLKQNALLPPLITKQNQDAFIPQGKSGLIFAQQDVSISHARKADWVILALPEGLQHFFSRVGCVVKLGRTIDKIFPDLSGSPDEKTGLEKKRSWHEVKGCARGTVIALPEFINKPGQETVSPQVEPGRGLNMLRHELGHVLHNTSPLLWDQDGVNDEFYEAYMDDLEHLSAADRKRFHYGIQTDDINNPSAAGMKELFAELFAALCGGGAIDVDTIQKAFPKTTAYMIKAVKNLIEAEEKN